MGKADLSAKALPANIKKEKLIDYPVKVDGKEYKLTCCSVGNPHAVVFCENVNTLNLKKIGPHFENLPCFPERINTEFVRVVNPTTLRVRVFERGNGETVACGTGACAAVIAATVKGFCQKGSDVTVKLNGGDLIVNYTDERVLLTGNANTVYRGEFEI